MKIAITTYSLLGYYNHYYYIFWEHKAHKIFPILHAISKLFFDNICCHSNLELNIICRICIIAYHSINPHLV